MSRVHDFISDHKPLLAALPEGATYGFIDPEIWWAEEVLQERSDGTLLCLSLYVSDLLHKDRFMGEYRLEHRCPDEGFLWGTTLTLKDPDALHATLKECLEEHQWNAALADTPAAHAMIGFVQRLCRETDNLIQFTATRSVA